ILREEARSRVNAPGIGLIVTGVLSMIAGLVNIGQFVLMINNMPPGGNEDMLLMQGATNGGQALLNFVLGALISRGAVKMRRLESYGLAMTACILGIVPCHGCCILGLIFGIWGLVVLNDVDVKNSFSQGPQKPEQGRSESEPEGTKGEDHGETD